MQQDGFEVFEHKITGRYKGPHVSYGPQGRIVYNQQAHDILQSAFIQLGFNRETREIALLPVKEGTPFAHPVTNPPDRESYTVNAKAFFNFYGIDISVARRFAVEARNAMLIINTEHPIAITSRKPYRRSDQAKEKESRQPTLLAHTDAAGD